MEIINPYEVGNGADTGIRAKARKIIDEVPPPDKVISPDDRTADQ